MWPILTVVCVSECKAALLGSSAESLRVSDGSSAVFTPPRFSAQLGTKYAQSETHTQVCELSTQYPLSGAQTQLSTQYPRSEASIQVCLASKCQNQANHMWTQRDIQGPHLLTPQMFTSMLPLRPRINDCIVFYKGSRFAGLCFLLSKICV